MRVVVAMSGGVDSSVAAGLLVRDGHDVVGVSMQLYDQSAGDGRFGSCCTIDDLHDARRVAHALGIPHYLVNLERQFDEVVVGDFVREYGAGRTPIPCAHCNSELKFRAVLDRAVAYGAQAVATGHYARIERTPGGACRLLRGVDEARDQSYFLFALTQTQLAAAVFPLGGLRKGDVRRIASEMGLGVAEKAESREICFVPNGDHAAFVGRRLAGDVSGLIVDVAGTVVGRHDGVHRFTIGQRKGLGLATGQPLYVIELDAAERVVRVGPRAALERRACTASRVNWVAGVAPSGPRRVEAQIRYRHQAASAAVTPAAPDSVRIEFDTPQVAITPGQAVVFYDGDEVIGGGWID